VGKEFHLGQGSSRALQLGLKNIRKCRTQPVKKPRSKE
jgi:hypothetical protein